MWFLLNAAAAAVLQGDVEGQKITSIQLWARSLLLSSVTIIARLCVTSLNIYFFLAACMCVLCETILEAATSAIEGGFSRISV